ncbi:PREDICTED: uncharacterized protein LOC108374920 [Rhagoletis zephyria]|uniref:uncharacterized protein LOC108374920 n=1 Tax=Rhagoletis zephyria TaxID=28612 RepID=UPI0008112F69|nr:PREDICTED: uncharacterized protein LOC108374920 [Rhagoletis zephyria]
MSKTRFFNFAANTSNDIEEPNGRVSMSSNNNGDNDESNDDDSEFLQDVPYSSSSIDRSSIGSIPWADDAIKQNQLDWERVERMLIGEEALPTEPDLRNEILEWQQKFPELVNEKNITDLPPKCLPERKFGISKISETSAHTLVDDLISHLSLNSSEDDDRYDELATPTAAPQRFDNILDQQGRTSPSKKSYIDRLSAKMSLLRIAALPIRPFQRSDTVKAIPQQTSKEPEHSGTSNSLRLHEVSSSRPQPPKLSPRHTHYKDKAFEPQQLFRMPPILNVLESKRRFRDLAPNKSFVQLTHVKTPHAKSAAVIRQPENSLQLGMQTRTTTNFPRHHQSVWQKPLVASRVSSNFFNNRNAIILPSLNTQRMNAEQRRNSTTSSTGVGIRTHTLSNSNFDSSPNSSANIVLRPHYGADRFASRWQQINANHTSTSTGTISTGRSISAAVHHPRADVGMRELYVPYNAYKHNVFK